MNLKSNVAIQILTFFAWVFLGGCASNGPQTSDFMTVSGKALYRQRIAMPPNAVLSVRVEDVSRTDTQAPVLAETQEAFGKRQVPIEFSLQVPNAAIDPSHSYNVRAAITVNGELRFTTTRSYPVLTRGAANKVNLMLDAVQSAKAITPAVTATAGSVAPVGKTQRWRGEFRYMADAATFTDCASGVRWPVAMTGDYLVMERNYLKFRNVPGAPLLVDFDGRLEPRPAMEGSSVEQMVVEKFGNSQSGATCTSSVSGKSKAMAELKDTYWKLVDLYGKKIPIAPSHKRQIRITLASEGSRVIGFSGCNQLMGTYVQKDNELRFSQMAGTLMACVSPFMKLESQVHKMLIATTGYRIEGTQLFLLQDDQVIARFEALYLR